MCIGWCFVIGSSILFAQMKAGTTYWQFAFPAFIVNCLGLSPTWMCCQVNAVADAKDEDQGVVGAIFNVGVQIGAPIGLAISTIIAESHTAEHAAGEALMSGYSAAFYSYGVMGGVGLILVIIFAANRDPAEFSEVSATGEFVPKDMGNIEAIGEGYAEGKIEVSGLEAESSGTSTASASSSSLGVVKSEEDKHH